MNDFNSIKQFSVIGHDWDQTSPRLSPSFGPNASNQSLNYHRLRDWAASKHPPSIMRSYSGITGSWQQNDLAAAVKSDPVGFAKVSGITGRHLVCTPMLSSRQYQKAGSLPIGCKSPFTPIEQDWDEAEPDPASKSIEEAVKVTKTLNLPALYVQGKQTG